MTQSAKSRRQELILSELRINRTIRVADLAEKFGTSTETIRRDLDELKAADRLNRTHGGATALPMGGEPVLAEREHMYLAERRSIAERAVGFLRPNDVVMMDTGTTTLEVARAMSARLFSLTVITNSYPAAAMLAINPMLRVLMPPGQFTSAEAMVNGPEALDYVRRFNANLCITGASGVTAGGPVDTLVDVAWLKRTMISRSHKTILLVDHSKFDRYALETVCGWSEISAVITDQVPPEKYRKIFEQHGIELVVAAAEMEAEGTQLA